VKHPSSNNNQFKPNKARTSVFYYDLFSEKWLSHMSWIKGVFWVSSLEN
jgi:hypothetical protein